MGYFTVFVCVVEGVGGAFGGKEKGVC